MKVPDSSALLALTLLARTGSISAAAAQMAKTHSAVSRKIKALEHQLGFVLTQPAGRGVSLTPRALAYVEDIAPLLSLIEKAGQAGSSTDGTLRLTVAQGFATSWLIHRLAEFTALHPGINLHLASPRHYGDIASEADLHITFATPAELPAQAVKLLDVAFFPVLSPRLLSRVEPQQPTSLTNLPLLHLNGPDDWRKWWSRATGKALNLQNGVTFSDMHIMLAAAIAGQGVALGDTLTAQDALREGTLIAPWQARLASARSYYLVRGTDAATPAAQAFEAWLIEALTLDQASPNRAIGAVGSR